MKQVKSFSGFLFFPVLVNFEVLEGPTRPKLLFPREFTILFLPPPSCLWELFGFSCRHCFEIIKHMDKAWQVWWMTLHGSSLCCNISWRGICNPSGTYRHQFDTNIEQLPCPWVNSSWSSGLKTRKETDLVLAHGVNIFSNFQNPGTQSSRRVSTPIKTRFLRKKEKPFF